MIDTGPDGTGRIEAPVGIDPDLLAILVCPVTRTPLVHDAVAGELVSVAAGLAYPVRQGVPVMLVEEARRIEEPAAR